MLVVETLEFLVCRTIAVNKMLMAHVKDGVNVDRGRGGGKRVLEAVTMEEGREQRNPRIMKPKGRDCFKKGLVSIVKCCPDTIE